MIYLGDDPRPERWRNVAVGLILAAVVLAATYTYAFARGLDANTQAVHNALDAATWATTVANHRTTQLSGLLGLSERAVRECMIVDAELHEVLAERPTEP
jgi:uncharacterized membrane protein